MTIALDYHWSNETGIQVYTVGQKTAPQTSLGATLVATFLHI